MQNGKGNEDRTQKSKASLHTMPTLNDMMKHKVPMSDIPAENIERKEFVRQMVEKISQSANEDFSPEVPSFNLGQQILSQHRKIAALKRKSPGQSSDSDNIHNIQQTPVPIKTMPDAPASPQQKVIAEIVAREIGLLSGLR